ncbi:MAG: hypothetical protein V1900_00255 [Candidatus Aenigmatarchaeota archaeon]
MSITTEFNEKKSTLDVKINSFDDIVKDGELTDDFMENLYKGYKEAEDLERTRRMNELKPVRRLMRHVREKIGREKKEYELPVKEIHLYPSSRSSLKTADIINVTNKSVGSEADYSRAMADRWELVGDVAVGTDLLIDLSALGTGIYQGVSTGQVEKGIEGFGYLAACGMALLVGYFIARIVGEEPYKRKNRYLTHILETPVTLHRSGGQKIRFYPNSEKNGHISDSQI